MSLILNLLASVALQGAPATPAPLPAAPVAMASDTVRVDRDTPIRLMVLNEVSSRSANAGTRFVLRVDEPVVIDGLTVVPAGAKAWGEVLSAEKSGAVGKAGKLQARLLHLEHHGDEIPISGDNHAEGQNGGTQVGLGFLGLGPFALFARGNNAKLKAGDLFSAYFTTDLLFDRASGKLSLASEAQ